MKATYAESKVRYVSKGDIVELPELDAVHPSKYYIVAHTCENTYQYINVETGEPRGWGASSVKELVDEQSPLRRLKHISLDDKEGLR